MLALVARAAARAATLVPGVAGCLAGPWLGSGVPWVRLPGFRVSHGFRGIEFTVPCRDKLMRLRMRRWSVACVLTQAV